MEILFLVWTDHKNLKYCTSVWPRDNICYRPGVLSFIPGSTSPSPTNLGRATLSLMPCHAVSSWMWRIRPQGLCARPPCSLQVRHPHLGENQSGPRTCPTDRLLIPPDLRSDVLLWAYAYRLTCHPGIQRIWDVVLQQFWWATLEDNTRKFVNACPTCSRHKPSHQAPSSFGHSPCCIAPGPTSPRFIPASSNPCRMPQPSVPDHKSCLHTSWFPYARPCGCWASHLGCRFPASLSPTIRLPAQSRYLCPADCPQSSGPAAPTMTYSAFTLRVPLSLYK